MTNAVIIAMDNEVATLSTNAWMLVTAMFAAEARRRQRAPVQQISVPPREEPKRHEVSDRGRSVGRKQHRSCLP
ncbi:MAG TPA: hypothetical protein VFG30_08365 [Polyangiales bacterium]|nr:hypothetical protein [Polyangiales bacterium]